MQRKNQGRSILEARIARATLKKLESVQVTQRLLNSPTNRMEELLKTCGSELERNILKTIVQESLPLPDEGQRIVYDADVRVAKPDFFYKGLNIALFVDGPDHDKDYVKKDDEDKRSKLRALGYRVYVIHYSSIDDGIAQLKRALTAR